MVLDELHETGLKRVNGVASDAISPALKAILCPSPVIRYTTLHSKFIESHRELQKYRNGQLVRIDGQTLSTAGLVAAARFNAKIELEDSPATKERIQKSRKVITDKEETGVSIYGLSTGFGGSADTRTDKPLLLGHALLQHQHIGILPSSGKPADALHVMDPISSSIMPEAWVRGAMIVRMNSLIRGHSGVRWELIEKMKEIFSANITPVVPLRGSISASGDLSPLSYIAGALVGNPSIKVFHGPQCYGTRQMSSSQEVLRQYNIEPISLASKEGLGILNGTAFSASVAALAIHDAVHLCLLAQVCTAMGTEALRGCRGSYAPFIHAVARPHPGQIECAQNIWDLLQGSKLAQLHEGEIGLSEDRYSLRQDRYPLRTSPQFLGPQIEDILSALASITQECNSTTDNPLIDGETGEVHHGGNFQAMAVTNAMEKTRLALHHIGKLMFSQSTELSNPAMSNGLPPSMAATDPSLNYHGKGIDIATAAYVAELGHLAAPVSTHIQSAEMHNQAVNSLALIAARSTLTSLQVLSMLMASYLYLLCQALDLRAVQLELLAGFDDIVREELTSLFIGFCSPPQHAELSSRILQVMEQTLDKTTTMDNIDRMQAVAASSSSLLLDFFTSSKMDDVGSALALIPEFRSRVAIRASTLQDHLRQDYLSGQRGLAPATALLGKTKAVYHFIRITLGVRMHGAENYGHFANGVGFDHLSIGQNISLVYEAIRDGRMEPVVLSLFS